MDMVSTAIMILGFVIVLLFAIRTLYEYFHEKKCRKRLK